MAALVPKSKTLSILDKPLSRGKGEVNVAAFALLFAEMVIYCNARSDSIDTLQTKLSEMGYRVGERFLELFCFREKGFKRETRLLKMLLLIKGAMWKALFGKEADDLEHDNENERIYYLIDKEPVVNRFVSAAKDKGGLSCAYFMAGILEAILIGSNFPAKVTAHWHKGTAFMMTFEESVIQRDRSFT